MAEEITDKMLSMNYFDETVGEFVFDDYALAYLQTQLEQPDWYFFLFVLKFNQITGKNLTLFHLKLIEKDLLYKRRVFQNTFVRLEAMQLIKRFENGKFKEFILTKNGKMIIFDLKKKKPKFYEMTTKDIVSVIENSDAFKKKND